MKKIVAFRKRNCLIENEKFTAKSKEMEFLSFEKSTDSQNIICEMTDNQHVMVNILVVNVSKKET